jgi:hypothetical protein
MAAPEVTRASVQEPDGPAPPRAGQRAHQRCEEALGIAVLWRADLRLDANTFDATSPATLLTNLLWRPFGLERTCPADGPLLPFVPRLTSSLNPETALERVPEGVPRGARIAHRQGTTGRRRGSTATSCNAAKCRARRAPVRLRHSLPDHHTPLEGVDQVDPAAIADLRPGLSVPLAIREQAPRAPILVAMERSHRGPIR